MTYRDLDARRARDRARYAALTPEEKAEKNAYSRAYYAANREACRAQQLEYRVAGRRPSYRLYAAAERARHLKVKYGLAIAEYDQMLADQGGVCAICGTDDPGTGTHGPEKSFHVDHNHLTGQVRGLLCRRCNTGLGQAEDSVDRLHAMAAYLLRSQDVLSMSDLTQEVRYGPLHS